MKTFLSTYIFILTPVLAFTLAQGLKIVLKALRKNIAWKNVFAYSDMPSGHSATVSSLLIIMALREGISSAAFAITFVFSTIVIVDALGLRNYLSALGKKMNNLHNIGHTLIQVIIGFIIGSLTSIILHFLL